MNDTKTMSPLVNLQGVYLLAAAAFPAVQTIIQSFFHEKTWGMWPRLKMSAASKGALLGGKAFVAHLAFLAGLLGS